MRGNLSDKLFPSILRDLATENATGRLRLTQTGKIREILIESGVPVFASSTIPEEQPEYKLVQEGLITPEQLDAAIVAARQAAQPVEKVLVQTKTITRLSLQRILCELSTAIVNSSSEWISGDYRFVAAPKVPLEAKLIWTSTECILAGARYASANNAVLEALAADNRTVKPVSDPGNNGASSASLSSTEGYVFSCIQSPATIAEASMLTGLSHIETRRAILVLIMLGFLEADGSAAPGRHEAFPVDIESSNYSGLDDGSSQIDFNSGDISFVDFPGQASPPQTPEHHSSVAAQSTNGKEEVSPGRKPPPIGQTAASAPVANPREQTRPNSPAATSGNGAPVRENTGSIFIPGRTLPPLQPPVNSSPPSSSPAAPIRGNTGSIFIPGRTASLPPPGVAQLPATSGSVRLPRDGAPPLQDSPTSAPFAAAHSAPLREYPESQNESAASSQQYATPPALPQAGSANSDLGYGWNGESDPRLHQEWRDQVAAPAGQDNADDERFLKRVIEELGAKIRIAASADYYQILGVDKLASNGSITKAYERITRINDSHKSRWPYNSELQSQISSLMVVVNKAYETLGNPEKRRVYDMPATQQAPAMEIERGRGPANASNSSRPPAVAPPPRPATTPPASGGLVGPASESRNPYQSAEELYRRGRAAFARSDLQAAAHLLRQAVNLDPNLSTYHYQLGMTLFILSQARAEHKHDKGCHVTCKMGGNLTRNQRIRHEAEQHLLKASELEPSNSDIKLKLALLYKDAHMDRKAHQYFYEALMLDPNCHIARVELGMEESRRDQDEDQWIKDLMKDRMKKK